MLSAYAQATGVIAVLTLLGLLAAPIRAEDWPQWRGPNRDGMWGESGIMESFPVDGLRIRWRAPVGWGWSSPVVAQGRVFVTDSQVIRPTVKERVHCFDAATGKPLWTYDESVSNSSPILIAAGGKKQLIIWTQQSVTSLAPDTGATYWQQQLQTINDYVVSTPVFHNNRLLIGGLMLELDTDKPAASVVWPKTKAVSRRILSNTSTPLFRSDHLFSARSSGELVCLEASTGNQVWETDKVTDLKTGASIHLTSNGGAVFLFTDKGELIRAQLTAQGYKEISRSRLLEPTYSFGGRKVAWTPPAFANHHIFARSDKELICGSLGAEP